MSKFSVDEPYLAGCGVMCGEVADELAKLGYWVRQEASSDEHFTGLVMGNLAGVVDGFAGATAGRLGDRSTVLGNTGTELERVALLYTGTDELNAATLWDRDGISP